MDASPFLAVFLVLYIIFSTIPPSYHHVTVALPTTEHATDQPGARREDSLQVMVTRNGDLFIAGNEALPTRRVRRGEMAASLRAMIQPSTERRVYIRADALAKYSDVEEALDAIRSTGIEKVTFIAEPKRFPTQP